MSLRELFRSTKRAVIVASAGIFLLLTLAYFSWTSARSATQPIAYSHKVHIETAGLKCEECHIYAKTGASASIPSTEICKNCHSEVPLSESPEEKKLLDYIARGEEVPWVRIYSVPDHVFFSHRRHVTKAELECATCHGPVETLTKPVSSMFLPVTMNNCMTCHREKKVSNDCLDCHR